MEKIIISCLESRVETNRSIYARFLLGPFKDDQAVTIATALRRSLLSQVKSIAITAIHIQGVTHEFSTIVGVRESVLDLALNFQQIVLRTQTNKQTNAFNKGKEKGSRRWSNPSTNNAFACRTKLKSSFHKGKPYLQSSGSLEKRMFDLNKNKKQTFGNQNLVLVSTSRACTNEVSARATQGTQQTVRIGYLQIQGPKVIYANDLKLPVGVECVDPTQYIATLSTEGLLVVKFVISDTPVSFDNNKEKLIANLSPDIQNGYQNIAPTQLLFKSNRCTNESFCKNEFLVSTSLAGSRDGSHNKKPSSLLKSLSNSTPPADITNLKSFDSTISLRNTIFLDPIFDSVFKVNYIIEKDDLFNQVRERILLELWTNGSIHPRQALHKASLSLISTFSIFRDVFHLDSL